VATLPSDSGGIGGWSTIVNTVIGGLLGSSNVDHHVAQDPNYTNDWHKIIKGLPPPDFLATTAPDVQVDSYGRPIDDEEAQRLALQKALGAVWGAGVISKQRAANARETSTRREVLLRSEELRRQRAFRLMQTAAKAKGAAKRAARVLTGALSSVESKMIAGTLRVLPGLNVVANAAVIMQVGGEAYERARIRALERGRAELSDYTRQRISQLGGAGAIKREIERQAATSSARAAVVKTATQAPRPKATSSTRPPVEKQAEALRKIGAAATPAPQASTPGPVAKPAAAPPSNRPMAPGIGNPKAGVYTPPVPGLPTGNAQARAVLEILRMALPPRQNRSAAVRRLAPSSMASPNPLTLARLSPAPSLATATGSGSGMIGTRCTCKPCEGQKKRRQGKRTRRRKYKCVAIN